MQLNLFFMATIIGSITIIFAMMTMLRLIILKRNSVFFFEKVNEDYCSRILVRK